MIGQNCELANLIWPKAVSVTSPTTTIRNYLNNLFVKSIIFVVVEETFKAGRASGSNLELATMDLTR